MVALGVVTTLKLLLLAQFAWVKKVGRLKRLVEVRLNCVTVVKLTAANVRSRVIVPGFRIDSRVQLVDRLIRLIEVLVSRPIT